MLHQLETDSLQVINSSFFNYSHFDVLTGSKSQLPSSKAMKQTATNAKMQKKKQD